MSLKDAPPPPTGTRELLSSLLFLIFSLAAILTSAAGGYGFISWALHPVLTLIGVFFFAPYGLLAYSRVKSSSAAHPRETARSSHAWQMGGAIAFVSAGAFVAWWIHASKSHAHFPAWSKPLAKILHVYSAYAILAAFALQAVSGLLKMGNPRAFPTHSNAGAFVWFASVVVAALGLYLPFGLGAAGSAPLAWTLVAAALGVGIVVVQRVLN